MASNGTRSMTERLARREKRVRERIRPLCETCGSREHSTALCMRRDDIVLGVETPSANGEYKGKLPVRVLPPGFSYLSRYAGEPLPKVAKGQLWKKKNGTSGFTWIVIKVERGFVSLWRRYKSNPFNTRGRTRVRHAHLIAQWVYMGEEVRRG